MDCFFGINYYICFVLVIYLLPIIVGRPKRDPDYNPRKNFTLQIHHDCFDSIQSMFEVPIETRMNKKEYFRYGIRYLRFATDQESIAYTIKQIKETGKPPVNLFLLYNGKYDKVFNEEFAYQYMLYLTTKFIELGNEFHPYVFCGKDRAVEESCRYTLERFGFVKGNMSEIINFAFSNIVYYDIDNHNLIPEPGKPPIDSYYALAYLLVLHGNTNTKRGNNFMRWPEYFCIKRYKKERYNKKIINESSPN